MKNKIIPTTYILLLFLQFLSIDLSAQVIDLRQKGGYTIEEINRRMPWNVSDNSAGLVYNNLLNYSTVGAFYNQETGDYRNYNTPERMWNAGAYTQAYKRTGKVYFYGDFKYEYDTKSNQAWLGTVVPDFTVNPVLDSIPGRVLQESYVMTGKVAYRLSEKVAIGAGINYNTSTMAKRKDGRNANVFSAVDVEPGICFDFGNFRSGINFVYQYGADKVKYEYIGDESGKNIHYMEGLFFATKSGITSTTILDRKYFMQSYGGAIQLGYQKGSLEIFNQFKAGNGRLDNYEGLLLQKRYSREELLNYHYDGYLNVTGRRLNHFVRLGIKENDRASYSIINNYELIPDEIKSWQYYERGEVLRYLDLHKNVDASYRLCFKESDWRSNFAVMAGYNKHWSDQTYKVYPDEYGQKYSINTMYLTATKFFYSGWRHTLEINGEFAASEGSSPEKMLSSSGTGSLGLLALNKPLLAQDFNYRNAGRKSYGVGGRYRYILDQEKGNSFDVLVKYMLVSAKDQLNRNYLSFAASYNF